MLYDVLILGGGASGLIAACALARKGRRVVLLEKQARVGRKLLSTGNGRCNLTNRRAALGLPRRAAGGAGGAEGVAARAGGGLLRPAGHPLRGGRRGPGLPSNT